MFSSKSSWWALGASATFGQLSLSTCGHTCVPSPRAHAQDRTIKYSPIVPHSDTLEIILRFAQNDSTVSPIVRISKISLGLRRLEGA